MQAAWDATVTQLVAIFVDQEVYGAVKWDLERYTTSYMPKQLANSKALVFPIDPKWFEAKDIQQILSNLYYDGEKDTDSDLVGVMLIGSIPFPLVEMQWKRMFSVYPYVNFVDPMFVYDEGRDVFAYNNEPDSQPQLFHSYLPPEIATLKKFFEKLRKYDQDPTQYAKPLLWYENFPYLKTSFTSEHLTEYIDSMVFAEERSYRRYNKPFSDLIARDSADEFVEKITETKSDMAQYRAEPQPEWVEDEPSVVEANQKLFDGSESIIEKFPEPEVQAGLKEAAEKPIPTLVLEKNMEPLFRTFDDIFWHQYLGDLNRNLTAGGRYELQDVDTTVEKIQVRDNVASTFLKDINTLLEGALDNAIKKEKYPLKYPLPVYYQKRKSILSPICVLDETQSISSRLIEQAYGNRVWREWETIQEWPFKWAVRRNGQFDTTNVEQQSFGMTKVDKRYENHYYGKNAEDISEYPSLTVTRGTYLNITKASVLGQMSIASRNLEDIPFIITDATVGVSPGLHAQQVNAIRAFNLDNNHIGDEWDIYNGIRWKEACAEDDEPDERAREYRGGWSPFYLDTDRLQVSPADIELKGPILDEYVTLHPMFNNMRNPSFNKNLGWPQYDIRGAVLTKKEYTYDSLHLTAQHDYSKVIKTMDDKDGFLGLWDPYIEACEQKELLDEIAGLDHFEEVEYFFVYENIQPVEREKVTIMALPYPYPGIDGNPLPTPAPQREERAKPCEGWNIFEWRKDYEYQIINTVVRHKWPTNEDEDNGLFGDLGVMHAMTMERPIDDTKHVTFHGLGGDLVKLIYPDLYRVPIYEGGQLKSEAAIQEAIKTYLKQKVTAYNEKLQVQLSKAPAHYAKHPAAFDFLAAADKTATPNRSYGLLPEWYFVDILGDKNIERLASLLYYMNVGREKRPEGGSYADFVANARSTFDINKKFKYVLEQYILKEDRERKQDPLIVPFYLTGVGNGEHFAYEMGYINSDGSDKIAMDAPVVSSALPEAPEYTHTSWLEHPAYNEALDEMNEDDMECGVPSNKAVPLFKRPKALKCRREQTISKPVEFELIIRVNVPNAGFEENMQDRWEQRQNFVGDWWGSDTQVQWSVSAWWTSAGSVNGATTRVEPGKVYAADLEDNWSVLENIFAAPYKWEVEFPSAESGTISDISPEPSKVTVINTWESLTFDEVYKDDPLIPSYTSATELLWSAARFNTEQKSSLSGNELKLYNTLRNTVVMNFEDSASFSVDGITQQQLKIASADSTIWEINVTLQWTGAACFSVIWKDICKTPLRLVFDPYRDPQKLLVNMLTKRAGASVIQMQVCKGEVCAMHQQIISVQPGSLKEFAIETAASRVVGWSFVPITVFGKDAYGNRISYVDKDVKIRTSQGGFVNALWQEPVTEHTVRTFDQSSYMLVVPENTNLNEIRIEATMEGISGTIANTQTVEVVPWTYSLRYKGIEATRGQYRLPFREVGFYTQDAAGKRVVVADRLPKLTVHLTGPRGERVWTPYTISTREWMVKVWTIKANMFAQKSIFVSTWAPVDIYLMPMWIAWEEEITIEAPGMQPKTFILQIQPSGAEKLDIALDEQNMQPGEQVQWSITIRDSWWNLFVEPTEVELLPEGGLELAWTIVMVTSGTATFTGTVSPWWGNCGASWRCNKGGGALNPGGDWQWGDSEWGDSEGWDSEGGDTEGGENGGDAEWWDSAGGDDNWWNAGGDSEWWDTAGWENGGGGSTGWPWSNLDPDTTTIGGVSVHVGQKMRPGMAPDEDLNIMYLNLFGKAWGNKKEVHNILNNSKTLAITTMFDWQGNGLDNSPTTMISEQGEIFDPLGIVDALVVDGDMLRINLWNNGGIWRVKLWRFDKLLLAWAPALSGPDAEKIKNTITYTPLVADTTDIDDIIEAGKITVDGQTICNFEEDTMSSSVQIKPTWSGTTRKVMYKNQQIGTLTINRQEPAKLAVELKDGKYKVGEGGFGWWSAVTITYNDEMRWANETPFFASVEEASIPQKPVGFREQFMNMTLFAWGQPVGMASKSFWNPFVLNIGDPLLTRIDKNRKIENTSFDDGVGQVVRTDDKRILKNKVFDFNNDGLQDMVIAYQDGSVRLLKNAWGADPYKDMGTLLVFADGLKELYVWDINGDGQQDLSVLTTADQLRWYVNNNGIFDVNGIPICLNVPNWERNLANVSWLYGGDMDWNGSLEFITYDTAGDLSAHYGPAYLSTDPMKCDDAWQNRAEKQVLKNFGLTLGWAIKDNSLRHRPNLLVTDPTEPEPEVGELATPVLWETPDFRKMTKAEQKAYSKSVKEWIMNAVNSATNRDMLLQQGQWWWAIDYVMRAPENIRPSAERKNDRYGVARAMDPVPNPGFEASKRFTDLNGGAVQKWDLLKVDVSLIPVTSPGPVTYRDRLDMNAIIYKDEQNKIVSFDRWNIPADVRIERNVAPYEFRIDDLMLGGGISFSYTVQYNGDGYIKFDVESSMKDFFQAPSSDVNVWGLFSDKVYADGRNKRVRAIPTDACYKQYREFSPGEEKKDIEWWFQQEKEEYVEYYDENRERTEESIKDIDAKKMKSLMQIRDTYLEPELAGKFQNIRETLRNWWNPNLDLELNVDVGSAYISQFWNEYGQLINKVINRDEAAGGFQRIYGQLNPNALTNDFFVEYEKCNGIKFGKKSCGGIPMPFNMSFLDPGTFNIFGCKLFKFDGLPVFSVPTAGPIPVWPPNPSQAGGVFKGDISQFRIYASPTITNGLWFSLCFWPPSVWQNIKSPVGDVVGNCLVMATTLWATCTEPRKDPEKTTKETDYILEENHARLAAMGTCEEKEHLNSPFISPELGGPVNIGGSPIALQSSLVTAETSYLKWGTSFNFRIEGGDVKWLVQCIVRKRADKQIRYIANNLVNMNIFITLPNLDPIAEGLDNITFFAEQQNLRSSQPRHEYATAEQQNPGVTSQRQDVQQKFQNYNITKNQLTTLTDNIGNPFEALADMFSTFPLFQIETREVALEIPFIYQEDLIRYTFYLEWWLERNEKIAAEAEASLADSQISADMAQAVLQVRRNLATLDEYRRFPTELYDLMHAYDNYMTEIWWLFSDFTSKVTGWMQVNANRFSQYVDTIILIKWIIETWQILIDFSVNRQTNCAKCRQDNYDFYSCKLKLLCVDLPVLPIPPFKFPDIYLDVSHINLGLRVFLPEFRFIPKKIPFYQLPDLPYPRDIGLNVNIEIPKIPALPKPPKIPGIPELETSLELELPNLPPAPKIPKIMPAIKTVIKVADFIGTVYCILKGWLWLVAEQGVKTRVEQMTQRTREVDFFDNIKITLPEAPLIGFDVKVDTYLNMKLDLEVLFDAVEKVADTANERTNKAFIQSQIELKNQIDTAIEENQPPIWDGEIDVDIDLNGRVSDEGVLFADGGSWVSVSGMNMYEFFDDRLWSMRDPYLSQWPTNDPIVDLTKQRFVQNLYHGGTVEDIKKELVEGLTYMTQRQDLVAHHADAERVIDEVVQIPEVAANVKGVTEARDTAKEYLDGRREKNRTRTQYLEKWYDYFLNNLDKINFVSSDTETTKQFGTSLFTAPAEFVDKLRDTPSPLQSYVQMYEPHVEWFANALERETPLSLGINELAYNDMRDYLGRLKEGMDMIIPDAQQASAEWSKLSDWAFALAPGPLEKPVAVKSASTPLFAQMDHGSMGQGEWVATVQWWGQRWQINKVTDMDFWQYLEGFFVPGEDGNYHNVVARQERGKYRYQDDKYEINDINSDGQQDIIAYTDKQIFVKFWEQVWFAAGGGGKMIEIGPFSSMSALISAVKPRFGWYAAWGSEFKLRDYNTVRHDFSRQGHNFDSMSVSWWNDPSTAAYIVRASNYVGYHASNKSDSRSWKWRDDSRYILVLPSTMTETGLYLQIADELPYGSVEEYKKSWKLLDVRYYEGSTERIDVLLNNLEKQRYYLEVAGMRMDKKQWSFSIFNRSNASSQQQYLIKAAPRSLQQTAGSQYRWDDQPPVVSVQLIRELTGKKVWAGPNLNGFVNTKYRMKATREDEGLVKENRVVFSGEVIKLEKDKDIELPDLEYKYPREDEFLFGAIDQAGNIWKQVVKLSIGVPEIAIEQILYQQVGADVDTELSDEIDKGVVEFEINRFGYREKLMPNPFAVNPTSTEVIWWQFPFDNAIKMKNKNWEDVVTLDTKTCQLRIVPGAEWNTQIGVGCWWGKPRVRVIDIEQQQVLFEATFAGDWLAENGVQVANGSYEVIPLNNDAMGDFAGWFCIKLRTWECVIYASPEGNIFVPAPYDHEVIGDYVFHSEDNTISYEFRMRDGQAIGSVRFTPQPFQ